MFYRRLLVALAQPGKNSEHSKILCTENASQWKGMESKD